MDITVNDLAVEIKGKKIFSNVSFQIRGGEMAAITGPSGCGKTTLLNCLGFIQPISHGSIRVGANNVSKWKDKQKTRFWNEYATFIYQNYGIIEDENVAYNVTLSKVQNAKIQPVLERVGLAGREKELAIVLSGGEKQRLGIARAIFKKAAIIYADEPTASLDVENRELVIELLRQCAQQGAIVILATHDERLVNKCNQVIDMKKFT